MIYSRNFRGHGQSHSGLAHLGACPDPDVHGPGGEPSDDGPAESAAAAAHDDRPATTAAPPGPARPAAAADDRATSAATAASTTATSTSASANDDEAEGALLHALQQGLRDEERPSAAHAPPPGRIVYGAGARVRLRQGVLPEEPPDAAPAAAHGHEAQRNGAGW